MKTTYLSFLSLLLASPLIASASPVPEPKKIYCQGLCATNPTKCYKVGCLENGSVSPHPALLLRSSNFLFALPTFPKAELMVPC